MIQDRYVRVGDIDMRCRLTGVGYPLVMVMGFTGSLESWGDEMVGALSRRFRLLLFDSRGAGLSDRGRRPFSMKLFANDTAALMDEVGIERAHVLGGSMGGMIAQELVLNHPDRVEKLILACTECGGRHAKLPPPHSILKVTNVTGSEEDHLRRACALLYPDEWLSEHPEAVDDLRRGLGAAPISPWNAVRQIKAIVLHNTYYRLPLINKPTLVLTGDEDILIPAANSKVLADRIPGASLKTYEGGGHGFAWQYIDEVSADVLEFLSE